MWLTPFPLSIKPADIVSAGFERLWRAVTDEPELHAVYFGLVAESVTDPDLQRTVQYVKDSYRDLIGQLIRRVRGRGIELRLAEDSLTVLIIAGVQGLTLEFLERGGLVGSPNLRTPMNSV